MRYTLALLLLFSFLLTGCVALMAGAAGGAAARESDKQQALEYYIRSEEPSVRIATAMQDREIVKGMNREEVRLVMDVRNEYDFLPSEVDTLDNGRIQWTYAPNVPGNKIVIRWAEDEDRVVWVGKEDM